MVQHHRSQRCLQRADAQGGVTLVANTSSARIPGSGPRSRLLLDAEIRYLQSERARRNPVVVHRIPGREAKRAAARLCLASLVQAPPRTPRCAGSALGAGARRRRPAGAAGPSASRGSRTNHARCPRARVYREGSRRADTAPRRRAPARLRGCRARRPTSRRSDRPRGNGGRRRRARPSRARSRRGAATGYRSCGPATARRLRRRTSQSGRPASPAARAARTSRRARRAARSAPRRRAHRAARPPPAACWGASAGTRRAPRAHSPRRRAR